MLLTALGAVSENFLTALGEASEINSTVWKKDVTKKGVTIFTRKDSALNLLAYYDGEVYLLSYGIEDTPVVEVLKEFLIDYIVSTKGQFSTVNLSNSDIISHDSNVSIPFTFAYVLGKVQESKGSLENTREVIDKVLPYLPPEKGDCIISGITEALSWLNSIIDELKN